MTEVLAIDLGGTKVEAALVREDGEVVSGSRFRAETGAAAARDAAVATDAIGTVVSSALACATDVAAVGVGSAGPIDLGRGAVSPLNLPALVDYPLADVVRAASGLDRVSVRLDGTCIALAEYAYGAARGTANALVMVVSTGVGGGLISDGRLVSGLTGNAGHLGQMLIGDPDHDLRGATVEGVASGPATIAWARSHGWSGSTGEQLAESYAGGDDVARRAVRRSARAVAHGLVSATTLLDLEVAVIGGGFVAVADDYVALVQEQIAPAAVNAYAAKLRVQAAALGSQSPLVGAAALIHRADLLGARPTER